VIVVVATACGDVELPSASSPDGSPLTIRESPSPYREVTAGPVSAMIPDGWHPVPAGAAGDPQSGFVAAPRPRGWNAASTEGMAALWVDSTRVGVPSDYYYLAATGPALDVITRSPECSATRQTIIADHLPAFAEGDPGSPGDFIARGQGTCTVDRRQTRWAYFVAAPGYGPVRQVGIPSSGLYLVVAALEDSRRAPGLLGRLLRSTEFAGASVTDIIAAARAA
jgi:hypothetical protein